MRPKLLELLRPYLSPAKRKCLRGMYGQRRLRSDRAHAQSDQAFAVHCQNHWISNKVSMKSNFTDDIAHAQDDVNPHILHLLYGTFSLGTVHLITPGLIIGLRPRSNQEKLSNVALVNGVEIDQRMRSQIILQLMSQRFFTAWFCFLFVHVMYISWLAHAQTDLAQHNSHMRCCKFCLSRLGEKWLVSCRERRGSCISFRSIINFSKSTSINFARGPYGNKCSQPHSRKRKLSVDGSMKVIKSGRCRFNLVWFRNIKEWIQIEFRGLSLIWIFARSACHFGLYVVCTRGGASHGYSKETFSWKKKEKKSKSQYNMFEKKVQWWLRSINCIRVLI